MQQDAYLQAGFLQGREDLLKQSKQFFEPSLPLLDQFFTSPFLDEEETLVALAEMIYYFKAQIKMQQTFFHFLPPLPLSKQTQFPKYFALLSDMTVEAIDLLQQKLCERINAQASPQALGDFYEIWLECCAAVYQQRQHQVSFLAAFGEVMNGRFR